MGLQEDCNKGVGPNWYDRYGWTLFKVWEQHESYASLLEGNKINMLKYIALHFINGLILTILNILIVSPLPLSLIKKYHHSHRLKIA